MMTALPQSAVTGDTGVAELGGEGASTKGFAAPPAELAGAEVALPRSLEFGFTTEYAQKPIPRIAATRRVIAMPLRWRSKVRKVSISKTSCSTRFWGCILGSSAIVVAQSCNVGRVRRCQFVRPNEFRQQVLLA